MNVEALHNALFAGAPEALAPQMKCWLGSSRRFAAFTAAAASKVSKKLRAAQTPAGVAELELELETAYLLLQERAFSLLYEPSAQQLRTPDFAVSFTTHTTFMLEVTRLHDTRARALRLARLADTISGKLGQLLARRPNTVLIGVPGPVLLEAEVRAVMAELQRRAERGDATLLRRSWFRDRGVFFQHYRRLSEVLVCGLPRQAGAPLSTWVNPQAIHPLPSKVRVALYRSQTL